MHKEKEERILQMVRERMPDTEIRPVEICKNNGCLRKGIRLFRKGNPKGVVVYWDGAEAACGASCTEEEAADYIRRAAEKELPVMICGEDLQNWKKAKYMVSRKLVNHERNLRRFIILKFRLGKKAGETGTYRCSFWKNGESVRRNWRNRRRPTWKRKDTEYSP